MRRKMSVVVGLVGAAAMVWTLSAEPMAAGQRTRSGSGRSSDGGRAVPRDGGGSSSRPTTRDEGRGSSGTSSTAPVDRGSPDRSGTASAPPGGSSDSAGARPREGRAAVGRAVPRTTPRRDDRVVLVPRYYYPWGYGGYGGYYGGYYGGGYYDPWSPYGGGYYAPSYRSSGYEGGLRLRVQPSHASVYVDGYYAGEVDEFDNIFQRLPIEPGPHRIEVRADGYQPLLFEVRILPGRTLTYRGELQRVP